MFVQEGDYVLLKKETNMKVVQVILNRCVFLDWKVMLSMPLVSVWLNTAKDRKGALHRTQEDRQYRKGPTKDCKGTLRAKLQEIGTNWTQ